MPNCHRQSTSQKLTRTFCISHIQDTLRIFLKFQEKEFSLHLHLPIIDIHGLTPKSPSTGAAQGTGNSRAENKTGRKDEVTARKKDLP
jgi:hypothetical protein